MNKHFKWIFGILIIASVFGFIGCPKEPEINIYTVTFNANGGILTSNAEQHILAGGKVINPSAPTRDGYSFTGWYTNQNCTILFDINNNFVNNSFTLYAGWIQNTYTVTFNPNNDNNSSSFDQIVNGGDKILTQILPYWDGYSFTGWYTDKECTIPYDFNQPIISSFTLYAGWIQNTYTITFNPNGGTLTSDANQLVLGGNRIEIPTPPTREGYNFTGWYCDEYCLYPYNFDAILNSDATLYAGWTQNTYTVTFNPNGGILTSDAEQLVLSGNRIEIPTPPTREGYNFTGWYCDEYCLYPYNFDAILNSDATLYAGWSQNTYTVIFNPNGGILTSDAEQLVLGGNKIESPTPPTREGYNFTGWYCDEYCLYPYNFDGILNSDATLYAGWTQNTYTITFNPNGGILTSDAEQHIIAGGKIINPSAPTRNGYSFTGWYTDPACTTLFDFNTVTSNFTLYAGWESLKDYISYLFETMEGEGPHDVILKGDFTDEIIDLLVTKIKESSVKVNLDLKNTKGLAVIDGFKDCTGLTSIKLPASVTSIGVGAFEGCTGLTSIEIPSSVTIIGNTAFYNCTGLTSIEIPSSVTSIYDGAFYNCTGLTSIEIPSSVTSIYGGAFYNCTGLTSIKLPESLTYIGNYAFYYCTGLTSIEIPSSVTIINGNTFEGCTGLTSIKLPESLTGIFGYAFYYCTGLTSIEIPSSVTIIGNYAFYDCKRLKSIEIPSSVTSIYDGAFYNCTGLKSIEIPSSVTSIGAEAFENCYGLTSIELPESLTNIADYAFKGCTGLTSFEIPSSVTSIGAGAFEGCTGLTSFEIPSSVTSIGGKAFYNCTGLTSVIFKDTTTWYRPGGISISVADPNTNATNLTNTYCDYFWTKK